VPGGQKAATTGLLARLKGVEVRLYGLTVGLNGVTSRVPREVLVITDGFNLFLVVVSRTGQAVGVKVWPPPTARVKVVVGLVISAEFLTRVDGE